MRFILPAPPGPIRLSDALQAALNQAGDASAPCSLEPRSAHPQEARLNALTRAPLIPFGATARMAVGIPLAFDAYPELVDSTGRVIHEHKHGYIPGETLRILERLSRS